MKHYKISIVTDIEKFEELKTPWKELIKESEASVFCSWEWLYTWWEFYSKQWKNSQLFIGKMEFAGKLIAIFPHFISERKLLFGAKVKVIKLIGSYFTASDYTGFIIKRGFETEATKIWFEYLSKDFTDWTLIELKDVFNDSVGYTAILNSAEASPFKVNLGVNNKCPYAETVRSGFLEEKTKSKRYKRLMGYFRKFKKEYPYIFGTGLYNNDFEKSWEIFTKLHLQRRKKVETKSKFSDAHFNNFVQTASRRLNDSGSLLFSWIKVRDEIVAIHLNFLDDSGLYFYNSGMKEEWKEYRPGLLLFHHEMEAAEKIGFKNYYFLQGEESYKYLWADGNHTMMIIHITRPGLKALLLTIDFNLRAILKGVINNSHG